MGAQDFADYWHRAACERMDDLVDVATQLRGKGLNIWRVMQVSEDGEHLVTQGRTPIFVAANAKDAADLWRKKVNPSEDVVYLYASEYSDRPRGLRFWQARLKFVRGRWYCVTAAVTQ